MVSNGLNKAPVALIARLLDVLRVCQQQQAGGQFLNHYANVSRLCCVLVGCLSVCRSPTQVCVLLQCKSCELQLAS